MPIYKVGAPLTAVERCSEGVFFEYDGKNFILIYNFSNPSAAEISNISPGKPVEIRLLAVDGLMFLLSKIGDLNRVDAPFNPLLSPKLEKLHKPHDNAGYDMIILMVDMRTNLIRAVCSASLDHDFSATLYNEIDATKQHKELRAKDQYYVQVENIYSRMTTADMANLPATAECYSTLTEAASAAPIRKSLRDMEGMIVPGKSYPRLHKDLRSHYYYLRDTGHVIMCVPSCFKGLQPPYDYEVGVPVRYVLSHPITIEGDYIYIDAPYDGETGLNVDDGYYEY